jgi:fatty-acyl-CoA synthase
VIPKISEHAPDTDRGSFAAQIVARAQGRGNEIVVSDESRSWSGADFAGLVFRLARGLAQHGIGGENRLALVAPNTAVALAVRYAAALLGAATVLCPNQGARQRLADFTACAGADVLVVFPGTVDVAAIAMRAPTTRLVVGVGAVPGADLNLLAEAADECADPVPDHSQPEDLAVLAASGGTTGPSKASRRSFAGWQRMLSTAPDPARRQLVCLPLAYIGQVHADQTLFAGGTLVLRTRFAPDQVLQTIEDERITHLGLVEPLLVELVDHPDLRRRNLSSLTTLCHDGASASAHLRRRLLARTGPVLVHVYGASEIGIVSVLAAPEYDLSHPGNLGTAGRPLPNVELRIENADGTAVAPGTPGRVAVRSPGVADGYTVPSDSPGFTDDVYYPGDIGLIDDAGYLTIRGRAADACRRAGQWIFPVDIEDALCAHPAVRYAVAIPVEGGFLVAAQLQARSRVTASELRGHLDTFGTQLAVDGIHIVQTMPVTEQGKPDRKAILSMFD